CFSTFPHGTCSLSVSRPYLALDGVYHPLWAAFPNNPDSEKTPSTHANRRHGPDTRYGTKPRSEGRGRSATRARRILYATIPERSKSDRIRRWAHPASLAVTEGILVSFFSSA
ncbi:unnamed protein product, partial [Clavelina lepadiformis]